MCQVSVITFWRFVGTVDLLMFVLGEVTGIGLRFTCAVNMLRASGIIWEVMHSDEEIGLYYSVCY